MNYTDLETQDKDKNVLNTFKKFLGLEHFGWKFGAIILIVGAVTMLIAGICMLTVGAAAARSFAQSQAEASAVSGFPFALMGVLYIVLGIVEFIPSTVISFIMLKKNEYYQSTVDTDISIARKRATSVGMIVFCFIFNTIAAIFYLINFIKTKNNKEAFDRIEASQKGGAL